jgi:hypothetical protein
VKLPVDERMGMVTYRCDGCGAEMGRTDLRYTVSIDVRAAYDRLEVGLLDLVRDHRAEILRLIDQMKDKSSSELEEGVYKRIRLDLCPSCQRVFLKSPLRFHPEQGGPEAAFDIDAFLRSLGYGGGSGRREGGKTE